MVRVKQELYDDVKSHLAIETCNIYHNARPPCTHNASRNNLSSSIKSPFIDWYLILRVGEDACVDNIRKQYHKLALLLHPDKNKHPKAEFAFKLISQAYKVLCDDTKRTSFNLDRLRILCTECNRKGPLTTPSPPSSAHRTNERRRESHKHSRSYKIFQHFRAFGEHLKEEARVIEACIKLNKGSKGDYPVFDPSRYAHLGYPHRRNNHARSYKGTSFRDVQSFPLNFDQRRGRCETPVFELRTDFSPLNINSSCVSS